MGALQGRLRGWGLQPPEPQPKEKGRRPRGCGALQGLLWTDRGHGANSTWRRHVWGAGSGMCGAQAAACVGRSDLGVVLQRRVAVRRGGYRRAGREGGRGRSVAGEAGCGARRTWGMVRAAAPTKDGARAPWVVMWQVGLVRRVTAFAVRCCMQGLGSTPVAHRSPWL